MGDRASSRAERDLGPADPRLFRFGFLCAPRSAAPSADRIGDICGGGWGCVDVGDLVVHHHPEAALASFESGGGEALVIGEVFTSGRPLGEVIDDLLGPGDEDARFEAFDELSGRFALLLLRGSERWILHDPIGSRSIYYRNGDSPAAASHAELLALAFGHRLSADAEWILASEEYSSRSVKYLPGDLTLFDGVRGLVPNNLFDLRAGATRRYWPRRPVAESSFERFATELDAHLAALAEHLRGHRPAVLGVTGGIDTRAILACFTADRADFEAITWMRRGSGLGQAERDSIEAIVAAGRFDHAYLDLRESKGERGVGALAKRNAGGFGPRSRIAAHLSERYGATSATFVRGYGAEIIRGFYNLPTGTSSGSAGGRSLRARLGRRLGRGQTRPIAVTAVSAAELSRAYDSSMRMDDAGREHERICRTAFEGYIARSHMSDDIAALGLDLSDVFYWEHRMGMWGSSNLNEMDPALLALAGFNSRGVYEAALGLPPEERLTKELLERVIARRDPALAAIPYL